MGEFKCRLRGFSRGRGDEGRKNLKGFFLECCMGRGGRLLDARLAVTGNGGCGKTLRNGGRMDGRRCHGRLREDGRGYDVR